MEIFFIVTSIAVIVTTLNIIIDGEISYNLYRNIGRLKLKVFGLTFFDAQISLMAGYFNLTRKNKKVIQIKLDINDENLKFIGDVGEYFAQKIFFSKISTNFQLYGTNPPKIAIFAGYVQVIEGVVRSVIKSKSPDTTTNTKITVGYIDNYIKLKIDIEALMTIFDFIWALFRAFVKRSVYGKTSKVRRKC